MVRWVQTEQDERQIEIQPLFVDVKKEGAYALTEIYNKRTYSEFKIHKEITQV